MYKTAIYTFNTTTSVASTFNANSDTIDSFQTLINRSVKEKLILKEFDELDNYLTIKSDTKTTKIEEDKDANYFTTNFNDISQATMVINSDDENATPQLDRLQLSDQQLNDFNVIKCLMLKESKQYEKEQCLGLNLTRKEIDIRLKIINSLMESELENLKFEFEKKRDIILQAIEIKKNKIQVF